MSNTNWEADKMLDVYIFDYLMKKKLHASARAFQLEGNVSTDPVAIDAPSGFLFEWWSVFWDIFIARSARKDQNQSEAALSYIESQQSKAQEMQKQQEQEHQQMRMQLLLQRHAEQQLKQRQQQQQCGGRTQLVRNNATGPVGNDPLMGQNHAPVNAMAMKMYKERLKFPLQGDALDDATVKKNISGNVGQLPHPNHTSLLKAVAATTTATVGQPSGPTLLGAPRCLPRNFKQVQSHNQQLAGSTQDIKSDMNLMMNSQSAAVPEGSFMRVHGSNQGGSNLTLKGWPLAVRLGIILLDKIVILFIMLGLDQLCSGFLQQNTLMQSPRSFNQLSLQQFMLQAQQNLVASSVNDLDSWRLGMLLNNQNLGPGNDGMPDPVGDLVSNIGTPAQIVHSDLSQPDSNTLLKQQVQQSSQQLQQYSQHILSSQQSQNLKQLGKMVATGSMPCMFQGNDQGSKSHTGQKRKQASSSGPANSSGPTNTTVPSSNSPATPSMQTEDVMSVPTPQQKASLSKSLLMFSSDGLGSFTSAQNQLVDMDRLGADGSLADNVESFLTSDDADPRTEKGFLFKEINLIMASTHKVECCHFSSDGKLLATAGRDKKASLWCTDSFDLKFALEEHVEWITDVRFSPSLSHIATSSADKTVRVWDYDNPGYSLRTFTGHSTTVKSLDFHPSKEDLLISCDNHSEIRYWSIKNGSCAGIFKGGATQMRFQPCLGRLLAAAADNHISILDVETLICRLQLQGHKNLVHSVCWDFSGKYLASVSDDLVRVWTIGSGSKGECIHELNASGKKFNTCVFHPSYPLLVIGCHESLVLWNFGENKTMPIRAHDNNVSSLAVSNVTGLVASTSYDKHVKIWK